MTKSTLKKELGSKIQSMRKRIGLSQEKLAELIGVSTNTISKIETGNRFPSCKTFENIASALEINLSELFDFTNKNIQPDVTKSLILELKECDIETQKAILAFTKFYKKEHHK